MSPKSYLILLTLVRIGVILAGILLAVALAGCEALDRYERSYSLSYEGAKATVTLRPRGPLHQDLPLNQDIPPAYRGFAK